MNIFLPALTDHISDYNTQSLSVFQVQNCNLYWNMQTCWNLNSFQKSKVVLTTVLKSISLFTIFLCCGQLQGMEFFTHKEVYAEGALKIY